MLLVLWWDGRGIGKTGDARDGRSLVDIDVNSYVKPTPHPHLLPIRVFAVPVRKDIVHRLVVWQVRLLVKGMHACIERLGVRMHAYRGLISTSCPDPIHPIVSIPPPQRAKRRLGLAATKRVGEIRGSTKKLRPQKGSGRARAGKKQ